MTAYKCRFCATPLEHVFIDLGMTPLANAYINEENLHKGDTYYPLTVDVCSSCFLVQLQEFETPDSIFSDYAYFSSYSDSWLKHAKNYSDMAIKRFNLNNTSMVVELASNDGYLLKNFVAEGIPCLGIEPAENVALVSEELGITTIKKFFGRKLASELAEQSCSADLMIGNNVLAHVPDINDFVGGIKILLKQHGTATLEFPHLMNLITEKQFDTIYHEHFSYLSLLSVLSIFQSHGLKIYDVEELSSHGGSLRIYSTHSENEKEPVRDSVTELLQKEESFGLNDINFYSGFSGEITDLKRELLKGIIELKNNGKSIVGYGAAAKGNTLLNYCGIGRDMIDFVVDRNPEKVGKYLPGSRIPVLHTDSIKEHKPDYLFILPWNLKREIIAQNYFISEWGGKFIVPIPEFQIIDALHAQVI
jgi:hypothetical protein